MAATYRVRLSYVDNASSTAFPSASTFPHPEEGLVVIDWITLKLSSTAGGVVGFELTEAGTAEDQALEAGVLWSVAIPVAAGETDTIHIPFPGGFPLKSAIELTTVLGECTSGGRRILPNVVNYAFLNATGGTAYIGFHFERETNRR